MVDDDDDVDLDDDDEEDPLGRGVDSVSWLPSTMTSKAVEPIDSATAAGAEVLPLFPLGGIVYTPNSEHVLNIFEPRYRKMYTDILMNGTKRFVVSMSHPTEEGTFARTGVLFQLEDLKEVSEQTGDRVKYICNHRVTGRVTMHRILNPEAWESRDTYLRVEGTIIDDTGDGSDEGEGKDEGSAYTALASALGLPANEEERALRSAFRDLVDLQHELQEDVRFTRASVETLGVGPGAGDGSLWNTVRLWESYAEQRLVARQNDMQREFQEKLLEFLTKEKGVDEDELPSAVGFQDLSPALQLEVQELQRRMAVELRPLVLESTLSMQKILEGGEHVDRLKLLRHFVNAERKRLEARKTLRGMFEGSPGAVTAEQGDAVAGTKTKAKEPEDDVEEERTAPQSAPKSIFMDEPDAFQ